VAAGGQPLLQNVQLVPISRKDFILRDVACSETLFSGVKGYLVLTNQFLGWGSIPRQIFFPWFSFPKEFSVIPLDSIVHVDVQVSEWGLMKTLRIHYQNNIGETEALEMQVGFLHRWVNAFRNLSIPVSGGEAVKLITIRGLINDYGWCFWYGFLFLAMIDSTMVWQFFHPGRNNTDVFMISIAVFYLINLFVGLGILWRRSTH